MKVNKNNIENVFKNLLDYILSSEEEFQDVFFNDLNNFLDDLCSQDAFGTEGQFDPRGNQRDLRE